MYNFRERLRSAHTRTATRVAIGLCGTLLLALGAWAGTWTERHDVVNRASRHLSNAILQARALAGDDSQHIEWRSDVLNQLTLQWAIVQVGHRSAGGGGIAEVDGHIVIASQLGRLSVLSPDNTLSPLEIATPMNLELLRSSSLVNDPLFNLSDFRTYDLLAQPIGGGRWRLYASFSRFEAENCLQFVVASAELDVSAERIQVASPWRDVFIARPTCIPYKDRSLRFVGQQGGGRLLLLDERTMLIAVGDHQFDGFNDARRASQDMSWDLGKLIALDLNTGQSRPYAIGLRNPQGLALMRDGRIIETEHGPQGGDEINVIREGGNYGWPMATYGMSYAYPRRAWRGDATGDGHEGYDGPAMAFVPSIGISNVVQPSLQEFPQWGDSDLLVASLRANTLFHVRLEGDRAIYAEPLRFPHRRLRDMISMRDGRVAVLTDLGELIFIRNQARHPEADSFIVTGFSSLTPPYPEEAPAADEPPLQRGQRIFETACASCHSLDGQVGIGPPLDGVIDRRVGSVDDFGYSNALAGRRETWTPGRLEAFLIDPEREFPDSAMPGALVTWEDAPAVVAYLRTVRAHDRRSARRER